MKYDIHDYSSIYDFQGPVPSSHPRMSKINRASQFAPFAALTGYEKAISAKQKETFSMIDFSEEEKEVLNSRIVSLLERKKEQPSVSITYYQEDTKDYSIEKGDFIRYDEEKNLLLLSTGAKIPLADITEIEFLRKEEEEH